MNVCVLVASYNRKNMTRRCLSQIQGQLERIRECNFQIYVYDDGSTDGTYEMLQECFEDIYLIKGSASAYWCKSMHYLMKLAVEKDYDYYLMVNDDVDFEENAMEIMFSSYKLAAGNCGVVGGMKNNETGEATYGGWDLNEKILLPNGKLQRCYWANWNCFLIDRIVIEKIGIIDGKYQHAWGDFDYSFRMKKGGIPIYLATEFVGKCNNNSIDGSYRDVSLGRRERLKKLLSPKGMPVYSYVRYNIKMDGIWGLVKSVYGYCSLIGYIILNKEIG